MDDFTWTIIGWDGEDGKLHGNIGDGIVDR